MLERMGSKCNSAISEGGVKSYILMKEFEDYSKIFINAFHFVMLCYIYVGHALI